MNKTPVLHPDSYKHVPDGKVLRTVVYMQTVTGKDSMRTTAMISMALATWALEADRSHISQFGNLT